MQKLQQIIKQYESSHAEYDYYIGLIEVAHLNIQDNPDVCIETCKSLFEGISKSILQDIDDTYVKSEVEKMKLVPLCKKCLEKIGEYQEELEIDFINRCIGVIDLLGEYRNRRGDISHGKASPKDTYSSPLHAQLVYDMSDILLSHIMQIYLKIDRSYREITPYDANPEFNMMLDEENEIFGILYSQALYDQDYDAYIEQLENYRSGQEDR